MADILSNSQKLEIQRKAKLGIPLTQKNPNAISYYNTLTQVKPSTQSFQDLLSVSKQKTISNLDLAKQQALSQVGQQQAQLTPQYDALRSQAATQSMQQARNLAEYMAARGQTMSGLAAQSELSRGSGLTRQLGQIGQQQQAAQQELANKKSMIEQDYLSKVANAQSDFELKQLEKSYSDAIKAEDRAYQAQQTAEQRAYQEQKTAEQRAYQTQLENVKMNEALQKEMKSQEQNSLLNNAIDTIRQGKIFIKELKVPGLGTLPSEKQLTPDEIGSGQYVRYIINNANQLRSNYGDAGYELLLKTARDEMTRNKPKSSLSPLQYDSSTGQLMIPK